MATTLLAIDDSVTMRKVLEMTFAGDEFRVVTAESADVGLAKLRAERPTVVLCDVTLEGGGGYGLCAKIKTENPTVAVVILASKQQPYDGQKGQGARADDFIEKPFDTQQLLEKVKRLATRPVAEPAAPPAPPPVPARPASPGATTQPGVPTFGAPVPGRPAPAAASSMGSVRPATSPANPRPTAPGMGSAGTPAPSAIGRGTLSYGGLPASAPGSAPQGPGTSPFPGARAPMPPAVPPAPPAAPPPAASSHSSATHAAPTSAAAPVHAAAAAVTNATNGHLAAKLAHLGLTDLQVSAVLALSRDVVEKVVWEVVPVLAETMIREELKRLTSE